MRTLRTVNGLIGLALAAVCLGGAAPRNSLQALPLPAASRLPAKAGSVPAVAGRLPAPALGQAVPHRERATGRHGGEPGRQRVFAETDLTQRTKASARPDSTGATFTPEMRAMLTRLTAPFFLRPAGAAPVSPAGARRPATGTPTRTRRGRPTRCWPTRRA
jgi:hypothetical protein